jgi:hypothetical protein
MHENHQQPEFVVAFIAPFANSFAQNQPYTEVKSYSLKLLFTSICVVPAIRPVD